MDYYRKSIKCMLRINNVSTMVLLFVLSQFMGRRRNFTFVNFLYFCF